jgi:hypothetical protein
MCDFQILFIYYLMCTICVWRCHMHRIPSSKEKVSNRSQIGMCDKCHTSTSQGGLREERECIWMGRVCLHLFYKSMNNYHRAQIRDEDEMRDLLEIALWLQIPGFNDTWVYWPLEIDLSLPGRQQRTKVPNKTNQRPSTTPGLTAPDATRPGRTR